MRCFFGTQLSFWADTNSVPRLKNSLKLRASGLQKSRDGEISRKVFDYHVLGFPGYLSKLFEKRTDEHWTVLSDGEISCNVYEYRVLVFPWYLS